MHFTYTLHALQMLAQRDIFEEWVERTVLGPDLCEADPKHTDRVRAFKAIPERDGRVLRVVYVVANLDCRVITLFFDRGRRR